MWYIVLSSSFSLSISLFSSKNISTITFVKDRPGHDLRYAIDPEKITNELNWRPQETFESGIRKTVLWYLENKDSWCARVLSGAYKMERLGTGE